MRARAVVRGWILPTLVVMGLGLPAAHAGSTPCERAPLGEVSGNTSAPTTPQPDVIERPATDVAADPGGTSEVGLLQTEVPNVIGRQVDEAVAELAARKWEAILDPAAPPPQVDRENVVVVAQVVLDIVDDQVMALCLGTTVPEVLEQTYQDADVILDERGLMGVPIPDDAGLDWIVNEQGLLAGSLVPFGTQLRYSLLPPVSDPTVTPTPSDPDALIVVPDLVGKRIRRARRLVENAGLVFELEFVGDGDRRGRVLRQDPPPGTLVLGGTPVTAVVRLRSGEITTPPASDWWSSWWLYAGLLAAIAAALVVGSYMRSRVQRRWVSDHISVRTVDDPAPRARTQSLGGPTRRVRVLTHRDSGTQTVKEVPR